MIRNWLACLILAASTASTCSQQISQTASSANSNTNLADKIAEVKPSVVRIQAETGPNQISRGTGFIVNKQGVIATARHVVCCISGTSLFFKGITLQWVISATENASGGEAVGNFMGTSAVVIDQDTENDLVILKPVMDIMHTDFVAMSGMRAVFPNMKDIKRTSAKLDIRPLREGDRIFITGYPLDFSSLITTSGAIASAEPTGGGHALKNVYWLTFMRTMGIAAVRRFRRLLERSLGYKLLLRQPALSRQINCDITQGSLTSHRSSIS